MRLAEGVWESHVTVNVDEKDALLYAFLRRFNQGRTLVFCNTVTGVKRLVPLLKNSKIEVHGLHAAMQQRQRLKASAVIVFLLLLFFAFCEFNPYCL